MKKIMFNDRYDLTKAVLSGRKTQTRRLVPENAVEAYYEDLERASNVYHCGGNCPAYVSPEHDYFLYYAKYKVGEVVAIAQSYKDVCDKSCDQRVFPNGAGWDNKMFVKTDLMPHHIRITNVRVEKLQCISDEDCLREGIDHLPDGGELKPFAFYDTSILVMENGNPHHGWYRDFNTPKEAFAAIMDKISGKGIWKDNPWVFVYEFELVD